MQLSLQEVRSASRQTQRLPKRLSRASEAQAEAGREFSAARAWEGSLGPQPGDDIATRLCHEDQEKLPAVQVGLLLNA